MKTRRGSRPKRRTYQTTTIVDQVERRIKKDEALLCFRYGMRVLRIPMTSPTPPGEERQVAATVVARAVRELGRPSVKGIESIDPPPAPPGTISSPRRAVHGRCACGAFLSLSGCLECEP